MPSGFGNSVGFFCNLSALLRLQHYQQINFPYIWILSSPLWARASVWSKLVGFLFSISAPSQKSSVVSAFWVVGFRGMFLFWMRSPLTCVAWERGARGQQWGRAARVPPLSFPGSYLQQSHLSSHVFVVTVLWWVVSGQVSTSVMQAALLPEEATGHQHKML